VDASTCNGFKAPVIRRQHSRNNMIPLDWHLHECKDWTVAESPWALS
jgi:hypothetical protein